MSDCVMDQFLDNIAMSNTYIHVQEERFCEVVLIRLAPVFLWWPVLKFGCMTRASLRKGASEWLCSVLKIHVVLVRLLERKRERVVLYLGTVFSCFSSLCIVWTKGNSTLEKLIIIISGTGTRVIKNNKNHILDWHLITVILIHCMVNTFTLLTHCSSKEYSCK